MVALYIYTFTIYLFSVLAFSNKTKKGLNLFATFLIILLQTPVLFIKFKNKAT